jgi:hypothetical protein
MASAPVCSSPTTSGRAFCCDPSLGCCSDDWAIFRRWFRTRMLGGRS